METLIIKAKEQKSKFGRTYLIYKNGRKEVARISYPMEGTKEGYCASVNTSRTGGITWGTHPTIEKPKATAEEFILNVYSIYNKQIVFQYLQ